MKMAIQDRSSVQARENMMKIVNKGDKTVYLVSQELRLARRLADNNKAVRDKALKKLKEWFKGRSETMPFTEDDFQRIWKGLFYCMWMSDKPLIQEECAENIANLTYFPTLNDSLLFFKAGLQILMNEWSGIDQLRLDKFLMLVRRLLRHMLMALTQHGIKRKENVEKFSDVLLETILSRTIQVPLGLFMHFNEIFLEELAKVTRGRINPPDRVVDILRPFIKKLATTDNAIQVNHIRKYVFTYLMRQSNVGLQYASKYEAWKKAGFPGSINSMQKVKLDADEQMSSEDEEIEKPTTEKALDPRAGRVDVELPQIHFNAKAVAAALLQHQYDDRSTPKSRKVIGFLADQFTKLNNGVYPLGITKVIKDDKDAYDTNVRKAANRLIKFENKLLGKNKKRRRSMDGAEKVEVEEKKLKVDNSTKDKKVVNNKKVRNNKKENMEEELAKFIEKSEDKKVVHNKKVRNNKKENMEEELAKFIEKSEGEIMSGVDKKQTNNKRAKTEDEKTFTKKAGEKTKRRIKSDVNKKVLNNTEEEIEEESPRSVERSEKKVTRKTKKGVLSNSIEKKNKKKKMRNIQKMLDNFECVIARNSGLWFVYDVSMDKEGNEVSSQQTVSGSPKETPSSPSKIPQHPSRSSSPREPIRRPSETRESATKSLESPNILLESPSKSKRSPGKSKESPVRSTEQNGSPPKSGLSPVKLFESPQQQKELFPKSEWDEPLQEGEYEICIPSRKYIGKMKKLAKKRNQSLHELINTTQEKIKVKSRLSLDPSLVRNRCSTPISTKKVKINTKLNVSQEVHEHHAQVLSSPAIPYDANRKPLKPLLKSPVSSTPINPFYNKQLSV